MGIALNAALALLQVTINCFLFPYLTNIPQMNEQLFDVDLRSILHPV